MPTGILLCRKNKITAPVRGLNNFMICIKDKALLDSLTGIFGSSFTDIVTPKIDLTTIICLSLNVKIPYVDKNGVFHVGMTDFTYLINFLRGFFEILDKSNNGQQASNWLVGSLSEFYENRRGQL